MSIEKIASKIEKDAKAAAQKTIDAAKQEAWDVVDAANNDAKALIDKAKKDGREAKEKQVVRRKAVASIDGRNVMLAKKQGMIDECFEEAIDKVIKDDRKKYLDFLVSVIKEQGLKEGTICLSQGDLELSKDLVKKLEKDIPGGKFEVSDEAANIRGGLILKTGTTSYNASIEAVAENIRGDIGAEVAEALFGTQEN